MTKGAILTAILFFVVLQSPSHSIDEAELQRAMDKFKGQGGTNNDDERKKVEAYIRATLEIQEKMSFDKVQTPCASEIEKLCEKRSSVSDIVKCLKRNRDRVSSNCEDALRNEFGGKLLEKAQLHNGVLIPKGSIFRYLNGRIIGATVPENVTYNGIVFKAGDIRFFDGKSGIWVAPLAKDQAIDGIKIKAGDAIGPFFNEQGEVVNATLAEDTTLGGVTYRGGPGTQIEFYSKNRVKLGWLAKDAVIHGKKYEAGGLIWYAPDGSVSRYAEKPSPGKQP